MDTIECINNAILNFCEDATVTSCCNGGILVTVEDPANIPGVIATVADQLYEWDLDDVQITTNQAKGEVYIDPIDREEFEDDDDDREDPKLWPADELKMEERPVPIKKGDMIQYRVNLVKVLQVLKTGAWVEGPYGEVQTIDWDDIKQYNPDFEATEEEEVYDYTAGAKVEWNGKPAKILRTEYTDGNWYMILRDLETKEEVAVSLEEFNKIQPKNV